MTSGTRWWTLSATWSQRTELQHKRLLGWADLGSRKYVRWQERYGKANEHNGLVPRDHWLSDWEKLSITDLPENIRWKAIAAWRS